MKWYCDKCKKIHEEDELCPRIKSQLAQHPEWISNVANFTTVAGEETLITTQALDGVAKGINKLVGTKLSYEGTQQFARDIQVFKRLNEETFVRAGYFSSPENAKAFMEKVIASGRNPEKLQAFSGAAQEVDWLRMKQGQFSSLFQKSELLNKNAAGVDGITLNKFTGETINRTTVKASVNPMNPNSTAINDVKEAIEKGYATEKDIIFGPKGTEAAARKAGLENPVIEKNTAKQIRESNNRLADKALKGQATTSITIEQVGKKAAQGAIVGAAVSVSISAITNYVRYKNGELSIQEAFTNIGEDTLKGAIVGGAMGALTIFFPQGALGFIAGMAIGIYFDRVCTNILDEIFGKGAFGAIMSSSGYVYGMTLNLADYYEKIENNMKQTRTNIENAKKTQTVINDNFDLFESLKGE